MTGKMFRVIIDKEHKSGPEIQGRFDLWVVKANKNETLVQVSSKPQESSTFSQVSNSTKPQSLLKIGKCYKFETLNTHNNYLLFSRKDSGMYANLNFCMISI
jgi:hypothetical protein